MAAVVADSVSPEGLPQKLVLALQRPSGRGYWRVPVCR